MTVVPVLAAPDERAAAPTVADVDKDDIAQLSEISKNSQTTFLALILASVYSLLTIATTTDAALLSNSNATALPLLQANVPLVQFYFVAPAILTVTFVYFHLYLDSFWRGVARLPLRRADGRGLDDYIYPWLLSCALIRCRIQALSNPRRPWAYVKAWLCIMLGWALVPAVLLAYWVRYVVTHDWLGTGLHIALVVVSGAVGATFFFVSRNALDPRRAHEDGSDGKQGARDHTLDKGQRAQVAAAALLIALLLAHLSAAAFYGPRAPDCEPALRDCQRFGSSLAIWRSALKLEPHAEVDDVRFVPRPANWLELVNDPVALNTYLDGHRSLEINGKDLRYMQAPRAFMPGSRFSNTKIELADLSHADLTASRLNDVSLAGTVLRGAIFQRSEIASSRLEQVLAVAARFDHAVILGSEAAPTRMSGDFSNASFNDGDIQRLHMGAADENQTPTKLIGARLRGSRFGFPIFSTVDFSEAVLEGSHIDHGSFADVHFSGTKVRDTLFSFSTFTRCRFVGTQIDQVFFEDAVFVDSELGNPTVGGMAHDDSSRTPMRRALFNAFRAVMAKFDDKTRMTNLELRGADLRDAHFAGTRLTNVLFADADLSGARFVDVDFALVSFAGADLSGADLSASRGLTTASLQGACGNRETRLPPGIRMATCRPGKRP